MLRDCICVWLMPSTAFPDCAPSSHLSLIHSPGFLTVRSFSLVYVILRHLFVARHSTSVATVLRSGFACSRAHAILSRTPVDNSCWMRCYVHSRLNICPHLQLDLLHPLTPRPPAMARACDAPVTRYGRRLRYWNIHCVCRIALLYQLSLN